jgi:hypothetical protein
MHGILDAKGVVAKLKEYDIKPDTMFVSWGSWHFDLSLLRGWLDAEGHHNVILSNQRLCLLLKEFQRSFGPTWNGPSARIVPLKLPFVFPLLFGEDHSLMERNHNALIDAQQLALMAILFVDLCKPPEELVVWNGSAAVDPWSPQKRQLLMDPFCDPLTSVKKQKRS